jgi:hypothetical protein
VNDTLCRCRDGRIRDGSMLVLFAAVFVTLECREDLLEASQTRTVLGECREDFVTAKRWSALEHKESDFSHKQERIIEVTAV